MYDTVSQYDQVLSGDVEDWHPPVMVRLWQLLLPLGSGAAPMFVLQAALYVCGFALFVASLVRIGRPAAAAATGVLAISPLMAGWQMVVLKDAQMLGAMVAAFGIVGRSRLLGHRVPPLAGAAAVALLAYATLVRANALFATIPLALMLLPRPVSALGKAAVAVAAIALLLVMEPIINHGLFGARASGVAKTQPLFDLAAIAVATPTSVPPFTPAERAQLTKKHCVKAFFWDPVGDPSACGPVTERTNELPERELYVDLAKAAALHPLAYLKHRIEHWNSTERWLVAPGLIGAAPPEEAEPNDEGLITPKSPLVQPWQSAAAWEAGTPLGWPIVWTVVGVLLVAIAWRRRVEPSGQLALALLVSALTLEASFLAISIASDLRYHLWTMTAVPLALILLSNRMRPTHREWLGFAAVLALVIGGGVLARSTLPTAPDSYQAMIHAPSG